LLARHAREHAPSAGHVCLARIAQGTVCKILAEQEVKPHKVRYYLERREDTSKHIFQLHGVNAAEAPVLRKKLRRKEMVSFFGKLAPTVIAIEACGASHHWARLLQSFGHTVKLIPAQLAKPYVKRGKNDAADAEALCEAMSRPTMRFIPVKTAEQQAALMLVGVRDRLVRNRTQLANSIRGYAAEFGMTAAKGMAHLVPLHREDAGRHGRGLKVNLPGAPPASIVHRYVTPGHVIDTACCAAFLGERSSEISQTRGATQLQPCGADGQNLQDNEQMV
jgi:hypothetical protein